MPIKTFETRAQWRETLTREADLDRIAAHPAFNAAKAAEIKKAKDAGMANVDLSIDQFAAYIPMSRDAAYNWFRNGRRKVPARKVNGRWFITLEDAFLLKSGYEFDDDDFAYFRAEDFIKKTKPRPTGGIMAPGYRKS